MDTFPQLKGLYLQENNETETIQVFRGARENTTSVYINDTLWVNNMCTDVPANVKKFGHIFCHGQTILMSNPITDINKVFIYETVVVFVKDAYRLTIAT